VREEWAADSLWGAQICFFRAAVCANWRPSNCNCLRLARSKRPAAKGRERRGIKSTLGPSWGLVWGANAARKGTIIIIIICCSPAAQRHTKAAH